MGLILSLLKMLLVVLVLLVVLYMVICAVVMVIVYIAATIYTHFHPQDKSISCYITHKPCNYMGYCNICPVCREFEEK